MLKVALTGNIAAGKSTVVKAWREAGAHVIESDVLARDAVARGTDALQRIRDRWGPGVLQPDGSLDRAALRDVVFRDPDERKALEEIVHPEVGRLRDKAFADAAAQGIEIIVADVPLLFEAGLQKEFDVIVFVDAPESERKRRLVEDRGLPGPEADRMIAAQWPSAQKRDLSDYVIDNIGTIRSLESEAMRVWTELQARAKGGGH